ncbi:hypothetical protein roselon_00989 [Roseibacterium elongatum DSM 19469]|uniref:Uncharacterized protein n=1 Tax=Roseicyclus elongatus DSM 19469 TaxID=1294273 RepID=W8RQF2_9RHOB|nr:hypothetical protein roselon_00989 [Roseibacterium elongatum DSM 19469]
MVQEEPGRTPYPQREHRRLRRSEKDPAAENRQSVKTIR